MGCTRMLLPLCVDRRSRLLGWIRWCEGFLIQVAREIVRTMSKGDRSAVDVFLSSGPMRIVVLEVHNPSPKVK